MSFVEDIKFKELFEKLFKRARRTKTRNEKDHIMHLSSLLRCLHEFLLFTEQEEEVEKVESCQIYRKIFDIITSHVNDSDFSFTSLEEDEFFPSEPTIPCAGSNTCFLHDEYSSSEQSFIE